MTIEQLQSEKVILKEKIEKALREFYKATGMTTSGDFEFWREGTTNIEPIVRIKPIKICCT